MVDFTRPADSLEPGLTPAQEARCAAVGNCRISPPVSAMKISARTSEKPGMLSNSARAGRKGVINPSIRCESSSMSLVWASIRSRNRRVMNA